MATRGTYSFGSRTFYCHWDNYPEGAAGRFWNAINRLSRLGDNNGYDIPNRERDGMMGAFYRENTDAEMTESHDAHGDTEYRYYYDAQTRTLTAKEGGFNRPWRTIFSGNVIDFIDRYYKPEMWTDWVPVGRHVCPERYGYTEVLEGTLDNALAISKAFKKQAKTFKPDNPNRQLYLDKAAAWEAVATDAATREKNRTAKAA